MKKYNFILLLLIGCMAFGQDINIPSNAQINKEVFYTIKQNQTFESVLNDWMKKAYGSNNIRWKLSQHIAVKDISFPVEILFGTSITNSIEDLLRKLNQQKIVKQANILIYGCLYKDKTLVIKVDNLNKGGLINECI